jgi:hypothetical protein
MLSSLIFAILTCTTLSLIHNNHVFKSKKVLNLKMGFENAIGAQPPLGLWDPLGLLKDASQERFDRLRYVETKHGRIAMLAILGHLVTTAGYRLPGELNQLVNQYHLCSIINACMSILL